MKLTLNDKFDKESYVFKHQVVLDALELLKDKSNITRTEIRLMVMFALVQNMYVEDLGDIYNKNTDTIQFFLDAIEPNVIGYKDYIDECVEDIYKYKEREITMNGEFFYAIRSIIDELQKLDNNTWMSIINTIKHIQSLGATEIEKMDKKTKALEAEEMTDNVKKLVDKFISKAETK